MRKGLQWRRRRPQTAQTQWARPQTAKFDRQLDQTLARVEEKEKDGQLLNLLYEKNIEIKKAINEAVRQNEYMKASIWKHKKQNRKLNQQVRTWHLAKAMERAEERGAIDPNTMEKVLKNQRFKVVSLKIEIERKQREVKELTQEYENYKKMYGSNQNSNEYFEREQIQSFAYYLEGLSQDLNLGQQLQKIRGQLFKLEEEHKGLTDEIRITEKKIKGVREKEKQMKEQANKMTKTEEKQNKSQKLQNKTVIGPKNQDSLTLQKKIAQLHAYEQEQKLLQFKMQEQQKQYIYKRQELQKQIRWVAKEVKSLQAELLQQSRNREQNDSCRIIIKQIND